MKRVTNKVLALTLVAGMALTGAGTDSSAAAKKPGLSKKASVTVGKKKTIKVTGKAKVKKTAWSLTKAGKKIVSLSAKKAKSVTVKGKKAGKATLTAKITVAKVKKPYTKKCTITVNPKKDDTSAATSAPAAATPTPTPFKINEKDITANVTWPALPVTEKFDAKSSTDTTKGIKDDAWQAEGGKEGGYAVVTKGFDGPTVFLDNRMGDKETKYVVSAWIKATSADNKYMQVQILGGDTYSADKANEKYSEYVDGVNKEFVRRTLNTEWEQIIATIAVPAHKFSEVSVICSECDFAIDNLEAKVLASGEKEPEMAPQTTPEPVDEGTPVHGVEWPAVPYKETFSDPAKSNISYSVDDMAGFGLTIFKTGGVDNGAYAEISGDEYDGAAVLLDNRTFQTARKFKVSFYVKALTQEEVGKQVKFNCGNAWKWFPGLREGEEEEEGKTYYSDDDRNALIDHMYQSPAPEKFYEDEEEDGVMLLTNEWRKHEIVISVAAGKFTELRIITGTPSRNDVLDGEKNYSFGLDEVDVDIVREVADEE